MGDLDYDMKVLMDMWLLSFMDDIVFLLRFMFGYVVYGFVGIIFIVFFCLGVEIIFEFVCEWINLFGLCQIDFFEYMECLLDLFGISIGFVFIQVFEVWCCIYQWGVGVFEGQLILF